MLEMKKQTIKTKGKVNGIKFNLGMNISGFFVSTVYGCIMAAKNRALFMEEH